MLFIQYADTSLTGFIFRDGRLFSIADERLKIDEGVQSLELVSTTCLKHQGFRVYYKACVLIYKSIA